MAEGTHISEISPQTLIRKLPPKCISYICSKLDVKRNWELLAEQIPKDMVSISYENNTFEPRYDNVSVSLRLTAVLSEAKLASMYR